MLPPIASAPPASHTGPDIGTEIGGVSLFAVQGIAHAASISPAAGASSVLRMIDPKALQQHVPSFFALPGAPAPRTPYRGALLSLAQPVAQPVASITPTLPSFWSQPSTSAMADRWRARSSGRAISRPALCGRRRFFR